ncbi:MAG TPA: helix-turn-helix transcriptional regulator [Polyangiaceae bacterium]|nr:helix-turn-helix transcriptional regulator [Polyangiaceae bacterium]
MCSMSMAVHDAAAIRFDDGLRECTLAERYPSEGSCVGERWFLRLPTQRPALTRHSALTDAERRVVSLVRQGFSNRTIAAQLGCSTRTVGNHLSNAYRKLGLSGRRELNASLESSSSSSPLYAQLLSALICGRLSVLERSETAGCECYLLTIQDGSEPGRTGLTDRQREILRLALAGQSNKGIAMRLGLSLSSVATHLTRATQKLGGPRGLWLMRRLGLVVRGGEYLEHRVGGRAIGADSH